jgi:hypothetical protein
VWVPHDVWDQVVDFVRRWSEKTEIGAGRFVHWLGLRARKFYDWRELWVLRDFWLEPPEKKAIIGFHRRAASKSSRHFAMVVLTVADPVALGRVVVSAAAAGVIC